jgi:hypothetical protein
MEQLLPDDAYALGVDEHTGLVLDFDAGSATIVGRGGVTVRRRGHSVVFTAGSIVAIADLRAAADSAGATLPGEGGSPAAVEPEGPGDDAGGSTSLAAAARAQEARFEAAVATRTVETAVAAVLDLEAAIVAWSRDTLQSDESDTARSVLRSMIVRLGELAKVGAGDPAEGFRPFVDALVELRAQAREGRDWAGADRIRDRLLAAGVEINDTPEGTRWGLLP